MACPAYPCSRVARIDSADFGLQTAGSSARHRHLYRPTRSSLVPASAENFSRERKWLIAAAHLAEASRSNQRKIEQGSPNPHCISHLTQKPYSPGQAEN